MLYSVDRERTFVSNTDTGIKVVEKTEAIKTGTMKNTRTLYTIYGPDCRRMADLSRSSLERLFDVISEVINFAPTPED